jgi:lysyl-tRNA synthetase class 2
MTKAELAPHVSELLSLKKRRSVADGSAPVPAPDTTPSKAADDDENSAREIRQSRLDKVASMKAANVNPYDYTYPTTHTTASILASFRDKLAPGESDATYKVTLAGRIFAKRVFGKLSFFHLSDEHGKIQLQFEKAALGSDSSITPSYANLKAWTDVGDIIGVTGSIRRTDKGELTVLCDSWKMLTKSLAPLPDKHSGFKDQNKRYRQRHLDMLVNPGVRQTFKNRALVIRKIRSMLDNEDFLEIETPTLATSVGGASAKPFETHHNALDMPLTLRIATELHLKRLIVGGFNRVYEVGRIFRNEGVSARHNPEFTSVELYEAYTDYFGMMELTERIIEECCKEVNDQESSCKYGDEVISFQRPWRRVTMNDVVLEHTGFDFSSLDWDDATSLDVAKEKLKAMNLPADQVDSLKSLGYALAYAFEEKCESKLIQPTFVTDHPVDTSPLAKPHRSKPHFVERFELFAVGRELANAYSELTDPVDQRERFEEQAKLKAAGDEEAGDVDEEFLNALETGMPPTGGLGIGIDRLVMLLTNNASIKDVIAFPLLKPE